MRIEILHVRDPDGECAVEVWIDSQRIDPSNVDLEDVDPGRGHALSDWEESRDYQVPGRSTAFQTAVEEAYNAWADNEFINQER